MNHNALKKINELIISAKIDGYDSISFNKYFRDLGTISDMILLDQAALKNKILAKEDAQLRLNILELL